MSCFCQAQKNKLFDIVSNDFHVLEKLFDDNIFLNREDDSSYAYFEIVKIDTFHTHLYNSNKKYNTSIDVIKIGVKLKSQMCVFNIAHSERLELKNDTLNYYIVSRGTMSNAYKLFGFFSTNINLFVKDFGLTAFKSLTLSLAKDNIISKKESQMLYNAISKKKKEYPTIMNKPCELLKYFFSLNERYRANTIILPIEPLKPFAL